MRTAHRLLAIGVAVIWGVNFLAIHLSLEQFPPFLCVALRWTLIAVPTILFVPRPQVPLRWLAGYGAGFGILQFVFLYWAMTAGMPTGLASLVLQSSAPFTVLLGALLLRERLTPPAVAGSLIAVAGLVLVGSQRVGGATWWPFLLTVLGGLGWALGNLASRLARPRNPLQLSLWMSVVPPLPMFALSYAVEGPEAIAGSLRTAVGPAAVPALLGLAYTCLVATVLGGGLWTWLMRHYPASRVAPFSMLVPVTGLTAAWLVLGERPSLLELLGGAVVIGGVLLGSAGSGSTGARQSSGRIREAFPAAASVTKGDKGCSGTV